MSDLDLREMLARAGENQRKQRRFERLELRIIGAESLSGVFTVLLSDYPALFGLDATTLTIADPDYAVRNLMESEGEDPGAFARLQFLSGREELRALLRLGDAPRLASWGPDHGWLFPAAPRALKSLAVLPLVRHRRSLGAFALGSRDPARFSGEIGTDFLRRFAQITALCLESAVSHQRVRASGLTDALTGVRNRRFFDQRLVDEAARAARSGRPLACVLLDIDHFKRINDSHGHPAGDAVLRAVAQGIAQQLRTGDVLARYGGEEFAALLPDTDAARAADIAERIRRRVAGERHELPGSGSVGVTLSAGAAVMAGDCAAGEHASRAAALVEAADQALYAAKNAGRNRVVSAG